MELSFANLTALRKSHPAWRLLRADNAPLVASFLHRAFVTPNIRVHSQSELSEQLEDELYNLRLQLGEEAFPRSAGEYLDDWCEDDKGWLRKFYPQGQDEPHYDLTPATEKALSWLAGLIQRPFVGTESRLLTVFNLLRQIVEGAEQDAESRLIDLRRRAREIEDEIQRVESGRFDLLDDTAQKDRFLQMANTARELLSDFREVEENFRRLDRRSRERIALWEGTKGSLLDEILGEREAITESDQGRSFHAFWDFLMSQSKREELSRLLDQVMQLPAIADLKPDHRLRRVHYDWLSAAEHTQRTVSTLSHQLRRFLDDQAWLENRRIMEILREVEAHAVQLRESPPKGPFMKVEEPAATLGLPMERKLFTPPLKISLTMEQLQVAEGDPDTAALFAQMYVDKALLLRRIHEALDRAPQVTLKELLHQHPLEQGLAELVAYLTLASEDRAALFDESTEEEVTWEDDEVKRTARLPRVVFVR